MVSFAGVLSAAESKGWPRVRRPRGPGFLEGAAAWREALARASDDELRVLAVGLVTTAPAGAKTVYWPDERVRDHYPVSWCNTRRRRSEGL
jgi:hypothetical protein